jgi:hypothetical protein
LSPANRDCQHPEPQAPNATVTLTAKPTPLQNKALELLDMTLPGVQ